MTVKTLTDDQLDEMLNKLHKQLYILRMAEWGRPANGIHPNQRMVKSRQTRARNARSEVRAILEEYIEWYDL